MKRIKYTLICCLAAAFIGLCACGNTGGSGTTTTTNTTATTGTTGAAGTTGSTGSTGATGTTSSAGKVQTNIGRVIRGYGTGAGDTGYYGDYTYGSLFRGADMNSGVLDNLADRTSYTRYYYDSLGNIYSYDANADRTYAQMPYNSSAISSQINAQ